jgi:hypothetical protein
MIRVIIATSTVVLTGFPRLTNKVNIVASRKIDRVEYQAVKLKNSMDSMLNPAQGGISPMPPPPPWIPPVEEGMKNKIPPKSKPKPGYGNYTPVDFPPSAPWIAPPPKKKVETI